MPASASAASADLAVSTGGQGRWSAAQLCTLVDVADLASLRPGLAVIEEPGIDDPTWTACVWSDAAAGPHGPALLTISNHTHDGADLGSDLEPAAIGAQGLRR